jgi:hypothetical protein
LGIDYQTRPYNVLTFNINMQIGYMPGLAGTANEFSFANGIGPLGFFMKAGIGFFIPVKI